MVDSSIEVLEINDDGTSVGLSVGDSGNIKDILTSEKVVLVINERKKIIWIWKGINARVRKKFIAARQAQEIKGSRGLAYKTISIEHGDEPKEFIKIIGGNVSLDEASSTEDPNAIIEDSQIIKPRFSSARDIGVSGLNTPIKNKPKFQNVAPIIQQHSSQNTTQAPKFQNAAPIIQQHSSQHTTTQAPIIQPSTSQINSAEILSEIESMAVPEGYNRELIIIGSQAYSIVEIKKTFMGEEKIEFKLDKTDTPDGDFLGVDYTPRTIVKNGEIIAIELLRSNKGSISSQSPSNTIVKALKIKINKK